VPEAHTSRGINSDSGRKPVPEARDTRAVGATAARRPGLALQAYFLGLAVLVVVVGAAAGTYVSVQSNNDAQQSAVADASFAASKSAKLVDSGVDLINTSSLALTGNPATAAIFANPSKCTLGYVPLGAFDTGHLDVLRRDGSVVCSSAHPAPTGAVYATQPWLQGTSAIFVAPTGDPGTGRQVAVFAYPFGDLGWLAWFIDLAPIGPKLVSEFGSGVNQLEFLVTSSDGKAVVARSIDSQKWSGAPLTNTSFATASDPVDRIDLSGTRRWYAHTGVTVTGWKVYVGADQATALAVAGHLEQRDLTIIVVGLLAVLAALLFVYRKVARPIESLSAAVRAASGTLSPPHIPVKGPKQVATLGEDFNALIASLQRSWSERESAQRTYGRLVDSSPLAITLSDPRTGMFIDANGAAEKAFGYSTDEFKAMTEADLGFPRDDAEQNAGEAGRSQLQRSFTKSGPTSFRKKDGTTLRAILTGYDVDYSGQPAWVTMIEDVTEKEKLERQMQQAQRLESLGQLAGGVAHDFNNLLGVILNVIPSLKEYLEGTGPMGDPRIEAAARDLERVNKAALSASRLTRQLLSFARREVVQRTAVNLSSQVEGLTDLLTRTLGSHVSLTTSLARDLWAVQMDPGHVEQVVINLAVNARDAMPKGGTLAISTANVLVDEAYAQGRPGLRPGRHVRLQVSDSGFGMDHDTLERVFEPFFTTKSPGQGTGLGLATVYGIVKQTEGDISVYSEVGHGTTVTVLIPATTDAVPTHPTPPPSPRETASGTVLVVEDYEDLRELIEEILTRAGYRVLSARDGEAALTLAREHPGKIDVLLTDIVMPKMLGTDLADQLQAENSQLRVIFMSGHAQPVLGNTTSISPDFPLLQKPFMAPELLEKLHQVLSSTTRGVGL
jgi:PAS domain S-box-containing protein